ncbi:MAG: ArsR/SmtB family transcription factor [Candidatus Thorarchaeota archaeon]
MSEEKKIVTPSQFTISKDLIDLILDPVRSKILSLVYLYGEITQSDIENHLALSRGTISHHLKKMVEKRLLRVTIPPVGRPVKTYRLNKRDLNIQLDKDHVVTLPLDISSPIALDFMMSIALHHRMFGNATVDIVNALKKFGSFDVVKQDNERNLIVSKEGQEIMIPSLVMMQTNSEQAYYIRKKIFEILSDFREQFLIKEVSPPKNIENSVGYLINLAVFPFPRKLMQKTFSTNK